MEANDVWRHKSYHEIEYHTGIPRILSAMKTHSSNANVQYNGCEIRLCLAYPNDNNKVAIADAGTHSSNARVQEYGCGALWKLALNNDDFVQIFHRDRA